MMYSRENECNTSKHGTIYPPYDVTLLHEAVNITRITTEAFCYDTHAIDGEMEVFFLHIVS